MLLDFTCPDTFAPSHLRKTSFLVGAAAAEAIKPAKYFALLNTRQFLPAEIETGGVWGQGTDTLLKALERRLIEASGDNWSSHYLRQRIDIAIQRGNAISVSNTFPVACSHWEASPRYCCSTNIKSDRVTAGCT